MSREVSFSTPRLTAALQTVGDRLTHLSSPLLTPALIADVRFAVQHYPLLTSTNVKAWEWLDQHTPIPQTHIPPTETPHPITAIIASQQQAGRGQWGRTWASPVGGVYLSVLLAAHISTAHSAHLSLASGWGIGTVLRAFGVPVQLKWPNDLVLEGRKLGGILTETRVQGSQLTWAVVGVGLNWVNPVPEVGVGLQSWLGSQPADPGMAAIALYGVAVGDRVRQHHGITAILPHYEALLLNIGQTIKLPAQTGGGEGTIIGVTLNGALRVHLPTLQQTVQIQPGMVQLGYKNYETERASGA